MTINVQGTYSNIATLLKRLPTFSRLCLIGPVTFRNIDPTTESVDASFQITFYLVADGPDAVVKKALSKALSGAGAPTAAPPTMGGSGEMPGGPAGPGMPGGPPGSAMPGGPGGAPPSGS